MSSAAILNATSTIINGYGLATNANILADITTFQTSSTIQLLANIFTNAGTDANVANAVIPVLNTIGNNVTQGQFLIDLYPSNITATCSTTIPVYGNSLASFSGTIKNQAQYPFAHGMSGFASGFSIVSGQAAQAVDIVGSLYMLNNKTYAQSGIGYTGLTDLVTGGVGSQAAFLGNIVANWGTMYDITNINLIGDIYVFGQNLLNHGLGGYGSLADKLSATGLNVEDITVVPPSTTTTTQQPGTLTTTSFVGQVDLPIVENVTVNNIVTGSSPSVITGIYAGITGANLAAMVSSTGFTTNPQLVTLADFLNLNKVVDAPTLTQLNALGIYTLSDFGTYLHSRIGQQEFVAWSDLSNFLLKINVPTLNYTTTTSNSKVLNSTTTSTLEAITGTGTGPFGNPVMLDYLGAVSGTPYTTEFNTINNNYSSLIPTIYTAMAGLDVAVSNVVSFYGGSGADPGNIDVSGVSANVTALNNALNALPLTTALTASQQAQYIMLNHLSTEVTNLTNSGADFAATSTQYLLGFGQSIGGYGSTDTLGLGTDTLIANLITSNVYGDTIRAVISETTNSGQLGPLNDPNPIGAIGESIRQNIPLSTYLSRNK